MAATAGDPVIVTEGLCKRYSTGELSVEALRGVDLRVDRGEFVSVMGPSGCGKSTLLSILGCLEQPTEGRYRLAGEEVAGFDERKAARVRRERIGLVFQAFNLLPRLTALQNVELPLVYSRVAHDERADRGLASLASVGLEDRAAHLPSQLSGGQQQRVAVARALVTRPDVVLADEPTGNLDSRSEADILEVLGKAHSGGATIVLVTHSEEVAACGTRIVHMRDGLIDTDESLRVPIPAGAP